MYTLVYMVFDLCILIAKLKQTCLGLEAYMYDGFSLLSGKNNNYANKPKNNRERQNKKVTQQASHMHFT